MKIESHNKRTSVRACVFARANKCAFARSLAWITWIEKEMGWKFKHTQQNRFLLLLLSCIFTISHTLNRFSGIPFSRAAAPTGTICHSIGTQKTKHENQHSRQLTIIGNLHKSFVCAFMCVGEWVWFLPKNTILLYPLCYIWIRLKMAFILFTSTGFHTINWKRQHQIICVRRISPRQAKQIYTTYIYVCVFGSMLWYVLPRFQHQHTIRNLFSFLNGANQRTQPS